MKTFAVKTTAVSGLPMTVSALRAGRVPSRPWAVVRTLNSGKQRILFEASTRKACVSYIQKNY